MNINRLSKILNLREGEEIIRIIRQYPPTLFWKICLAIIFIVLPFFFMFPLFSWGSWGILIFIIIIVIAFIYTLRIFISWRFNTSIITNYRVVDVDQRGFFDKIVSGITYDKIQDISYRQHGLWQTLFHYGSVQLQLANTNTKIKLKKIHYPQEIQELLLELQHNYQPPETKTEQREAGRVEDAWDKIKGLKAEELSLLNQKIIAKLEDREKAFKSILGKDEE